MQLKESTKRHTHTHTHKIYMHIYVDIALELVGSTPKRVFLQIICPDVSPISMEYPLTRNH